MDNKLFSYNGNLSGCTIKRDYVCPTCGEETYSHRFKHGKKTHLQVIYVFPPSNHPFRKKNHLMVSKGFHCLHNH